MSSDNRDQNPLYDVQASSDKTTVWVHGPDGSCVGRFSKKFGLDVHTSITDQMRGASQCLNCTHEPASIKDWEAFRSDMMTHFNIPVDRELIAWTQEEIANQLSNISMEGEIVFKVIEMDSTFSNNLSEVIEIKGMLGETDRLTFSKAVDVLIEQKKHGYILSMDEIIYKISPVGQQFIKADIKIVSDEGSVTQAHSLFQAPPKLPSMKHAKRF